MQEDSNKQNQVVFSIKDLECSYKPNKPVLKVKNLEIYKGEIVVLLGPSGSGKSTFLETLGLMTKTIEKGSVVFTPSEDVTYDFKDIWDKKSEPVRTKARKENFNFIFQDTNLMQNLSNRENVSIAELVNEINIGKSFEKSGSTLLELNLPSDSHDKGPRNISGGERQRVAFARSIQRDFSVLFGDEPTGNLDEENAQQVMIYTELKILDREASKTAIIVSHNVSLSMQYADRIIILAKTHPDNPYYEILDKNIFKRKCRDKANPCIWINDGRELSQEEARKKMANVFKSSLIKKELEESDSPPKLFEENGSLNFKLPGQTGLFASLCMFTRSISRLKKYLPKDFSHLFFAKEGYVLMGGKQRTTFWVFLVALFIVLNIIGFSMGSLDSLRQKMRDPFVNAVQAHHVGGVHAQEEIGNTIADFLERSDYFLLDTIYAYNRFFLQLSRSANPDERVPNFVGKSILHNDPILERVLDPSINDAIGRSFTDVTDKGIIVSRDMLQRLGLDDDAKFVFMERLADGKNYYRVPVPIIAVVDNLPGRNRSYFLSTQVFYENFMDKGSNFLIEDSPSFRISALLDEEQSVLFEEALFSAFSDISATDDTYERFNIRKEYITDLTHSGFYEYNITIRPHVEQSLAINQELYERAMANPGIVNLLDSLDKKVNMDVFQSFVPNYDEFMVDDLAEKDEIAFVFKETGMIREFASEFSRATQNRIELDLATVENMYTFNLVSRLAMSIIVTLIIASIIAIFQYVQNLLNNHLYKIRMNIGTFKAFGINVGNIYAIMLYTFVFTAVLVAFFATILVGFLVTYFGWFDFSLFGDWTARLTTAGTIIIVFVCTWVVLYLANKKFFSQSPGDLIYDRLEKIVDYTDDEKPLNENIDQQLEAELLKAGAE